nr:APC family permease [Sulfodiicoccus acidiphilus]
MLGTILAGFLFYTGYGVPLFFAEESKAPFRTVWKSIVLGVIVPTLVGIVAVYSEVVAINPANAASLASDWNPAVVAYLPYLGLAGALVYLVVALLGQAFGAFVPGMGSARLIYSMARDKFLDSEWLRRVHPKYGTPANAGLLNLAVGTVATLVVELLMFQLYGYHQGVFNSVFLAGSMVVAYWFLHHMIPDVSLAFIYRRFKVKITNPRNFFVSVVAPAVGLAIFAYSFYEGYSSLTEPYLGGFIFFAITCVAGALYVWWRARRNDLGESVVSTKVNDELLRNLTREAAETQRETK